MTAVVEVGTAKFRMLAAGGTRELFVYGTERSSVTTIKNAEQLPKLAYFGKIKAGIAYKDQIITCDFAPDSSDIIVIASSSVAIPYSWQLVDKDHKRLQGAVINGAHLTYAGHSGYKMTFTDPTAAVTAGAFHLWGQYTIPTGYRATIGRRVRENSWLLMDVFDDTT